ncbi:MAG TPA: DUF3108 domain-containing protein [Terriglobales bacterium]|nr:DUF3108 domain-containing protein [Terriglobales bacterium]
MVGRWGLALALATGLATPTGQTPAPAALPAGTLHYAAHWRLLPAGRATLAWDGSGAERHIQFTADSSGLVSLFYPVQDRMHSTYDPGSFCTTAVDNDTLEGKRQRQTHIRFNAAMHQLTLDEVDTAHQPPVAKHEVKPIPGCVLDLFGALDYVRSQPLHVGDVYNFPVNEGGTTSEIKLSVDLKETVSTPAGTFGTVRTEPTLFDSSVFHRPGQMWVWFSDDARHLPVQVEAKVSWGTILVQLSN